MKFIDTPPTPEPTICAKVERPAGGHPDDTPELVVYLDGRRIRIAFFSDADATLVFYDLSSDDIAAMATAGIKASSGREWPVA